MKNGIRNKNETLWNTIYSLVKGISNFKLIAKVNKKEKKQKRFSKKSKVNREL